MELELSHLSDEDLLHIFSFFKAKDLLSVRKVCHRWRSIADSKSLWRNIKLKMGVLDANPYEEEREIPNRVFKSVRALKSLHLCSKTAKPICIYKKINMRCSPFLNETAKILDGNLEEIRNLEISVSYTTLPAWTVIFDRFREHLESLTLDTHIVLNEEPVDYYPHPSGEMAPYYNYIEEPIIGNCPNLRSLKAAVYQHNKGIFKANEHDWPSLTHLHLGSASGYSLLDYLQPNKLLRVLRNQLEFIKLDEMHNPNFKDIPQFLSFPKLKELHVIFCFGEFRWELKPLVTLKVHHYVIHHRNCTLPIHNDVATYRLIDNLVMRFCNHSYGCIRKFVKSCVNLTKLTLIEDCPSDLDEDHDNFEANGLAYARRILRKLKNLRFLEMVGCVRFASFDVTGLREEFPQVEIVINNDRDSALRKFSFFGGVLLEPRFTYEEDL